MQPSHLEIANQILKTDEEYASDKTLDKLLPGPTETVGNQFMRVTDGFVILLQRKIPCFSRTDTRRGIGLSSMKSSMKSTQLSSIRHPCQEEDEENLLQNK